MRLRLAYTLALVLLLAVFAAVVAMGAVTTWNLKNGFSDYLAARDAERLDQFAALASAAADEAGGLQAIRDRSPHMRELLDRYAQSQGLRRRPLRPPNSAAGADAPPAGPPMGPADGFASRLAIVGLDGQAVFDRPSLQSAEKYLDRPIRVQGQTVAWARLRLSNTKIDSVDARFLRTQYVGLGVVATLLMLLALASAWWVSRWLLRPLQAVQNAAALIARGSFDVRIPCGGNEAQRSDEMGDLVRDINQMAEGLQRLEQARRRWLADISHELRTPLTVLQGEIDALWDGVRPLGRDAVRSLQEEVVKLGSLVEDLHMLAMSDLNALPCHPKNMDAVAFVRQLVARFQPQAATAGLRLDFEHREPAALRVCWDPGRIEQLIGNLVENSIRYTDTPGRIELRLESLGSHVEIRLRDSAPGVGEADMERLFEPLFRSAVARGRHPGGSGLGLAISHAIARSHRGQLTVHTSALGGLEISIRLPMCAEASEP